MILLFVCGLLLVGLSIPLIQRRVRPNGLYGLRVTATLADEDVWYDANERSGWDLLWFGVALSILALLPPLFGADGWVFALLWVALAVSGALAMLVIGWRRADRMLRDRKKNQSERRL